jgi:hypothetical protein
MTSEDVITAQFEAPSRHLPGGTEENHKTSLEWPNVLTKMWTDPLLNSSQQHYHLNQLAQSVTYYNPSDLESHVSIHVWRCSGPSCQGSEEPGYLKTLQLTSSFILTLIIVSRDMSENSVFSLMGMVVLSSIRNWMKTLILSLTKVREKGKAIPVTGHRGSHIF